MHFNTSISGQSDRHLTFITSTEDKLHEHSRVVVHEVENFRVPFLSAELYTVCRVKCHC